MWWSQWPRPGSNEVHFNNYICTQTTWPTPFPRGLPSLDYLFGYGKRIVYRTLVQNVYSSERSFTKNRHNHNNTDISVEQEIIRKAGVRLLLRTPCSSVQHWSCGWEFVHIFINCCNAWQSPIRIPFRNFRRYSPRGTFQNTVTNTYSLFNGILEFVSQNKVKHFVTSLLWLQKAEWY